MKDLKGTKESTNGVVPACNSNRVLWHYLVGRRIWNKRRWTIQSLYGNWSAGNRNKSKYRLKKAASPNYKVKITDEINEVLMGLRCRTDQMRPLNLGLWAFHGKYGGDWDCNRILFSYLQVSAIKLGLWRCCFLMWMIMRDSKIHTTALTRKRGKWIENKNRERSAKFSSFVKGEVRWGG